MIKVTQHTLTQHLTDEYDNIYLRADNAAIEYYIELDTKRCFMPSKRANGRIITIKPFELDLPIAYINLLQNCIDIIDKYNLYPALCGFDTNPDELAFVHSSVKMLRDNFLNILEWLDIDTKVCINIPHEVK